jgi:hypothetical protein
MRRDSDDSATFAAPVWQNDMPNALAMLACLVALVVVIRAQPRLRHTTLLPAGRWALAAVLAWCGLSVAAVLVEPAWAGWLDHAWYWASLLMICPSIAVLGARRPGAGAWNWFVLMPLLAVLGWPAITSLAGNPQASLLHLETPSLLAVGLVWLMGAGNYVGTRFTGPAALYALAIAVAILPASGLLPEHLTREGMRQLASVLLGSAAVWAAGIARARSAVPPGPDRLVEDFRDQFGIVWARRLQDRFNAQAEQQVLPVRLSPWGIVWDAALPQPIDPAQFPEVSQSLRWMLKRFVDAAWLDERLGTGTSPGTASDSTAGTGL